MPTADRSSGTDAHRLVAGRGRDCVAAYPIRVGDHVGRVIEAGWGDRTLICLHGAGSRADRWTPALPGLADLGFHVYALDFPGHGFSSKPSDFDYSAPRFAQWTAAAIEELGVGPVTIAGTSLGGHVAALVAVEQPQLVDGLICIGSTGLTEFPVEFHRPPEIVSDASAEGVRRKLSLLVSDGAQVTDLWVREESMVNSSPGAAQALGATAKYLNDGTNEHLAAERLAVLDFERPILLVWGADDGWTPPSLGESARDALPNSTLKLMPGCGHAPYFEDPEGFVQLVADHFNLKGDR